MTSMQIIEKEKAFIDDMCDRINNIILFNYTFDRDKFKSNYEYMKGDSVPRVTSVLSTMIAKDYLLPWANSLGFKHIGYSKYMKEASEKGTYTHLLIEKFLNDENYDIEWVPGYAKEAISNGFNSFKYWYDIVSSKNNVKVITTEKRCVNYFFGGTVDCIMEINGKLWLVDFKTSNHLSWEYFIQLAAYMYLLKDEYDLAGLMVLQLSKTEVNFDEAIIDFSNSNDLELITNCLRQFFVLLLGYYGRVDIAIKSRTKFLKGE